MVAYFNKEYVATGIFEKDMGRKLARLQQLREKSDYDDFFIASQEEASSQSEAAKDIINAVTDSYVMTNDWFVWIPAGFLILLTVLAFNFIGDGLRDAFDPKMKR